MSLIVPIMINSTTIGALVINRTEKLRSGKGDTHHYQWELAMNGGKTLRGERGPEYYGGTIEHSYSDGAVQLIKKVFAQIP